MRDAAAGKTVKKEGTYGYDDNTSEPKVNFFYRDGDLLRNDPIFGFTADVNDSGGKPLVST